MSTIVNNIANFFNWESWFRSIFDKVLPNLFDKKELNAAGEVIISGYEFDTGTDGSFILKNLIFKVDVINKFISHKKVKLVYGCIGRLELKIPFTYLSVTCHLPGGFAYSSDNQIGINIDDVVFLIAPDYALNSNIYNDRENNLKKDYLTAMEMFLENTSKSSQIPSHKLHSMLSNIITAVLKSFSFSVTNLHVRYEDCQSVQVNVQKHQKLQRSSSFGKYNKDIAHDDASTPGSVDLNSPRSIISDGLSSVSSGGKANSKSKSNSTKWSKFAFGITMQTLKFDSISNDEKISGFNLSVDIDKEKVEFEHFFDPRDDDYESNSSKVCIKKSLEVRQFSVYWNPILYEQGDERWEKLFKKSKNGIPSLPKVVADELENMYIAHKGFDPFRFSRPNSRKPKNFKEKIFRDMINSIPKAKNDLKNPHHHYILFPLDMDMLMGMNYGSNFSNLKVNTKIVIPHLNVAVEDRQLKELIDFQINMGQLMYHQKYYFYRQSVKLFKYRLKEVKNAVEYEPDNIELKKLEETSSKELKVDQVRFCWKQKLLEVKESNLELYVPFNSSQLNSPNSDLAITMDPYKQLGYLSRGAKFKYFFDQFCGFKAVYTELWKFKISNSDLRKLSSNINFEDKRKFIMLSKLKASPPDDRGLSETPMTEVSPNQARYSKEIDDFGSMAWVFQDQLLPADSCKFMSMTYQKIKDDELKSIRSAVDLFHSLREAKRRVTRGHSKKLDIEADIRLLIIKKWLHRHQYDLESPSARAFFDKFQADFYKIKKSIEKKKNANKEMKEDLQPCDDIWIHKFAKKFHKCMCDSLLDEGNVPNVTFLWTQFKEYYRTSPTSTAIKLNLDIFIKGLVDTFTGKSFLALIITLDPTSSGDVQLFSKALESMDIAEINLKMKKLEGDLTEVNKSILEAKSEVKLIVNPSKPDRKARAELDQKIVNLIDVIEFYIKKSEDIYSLRALAKEELASSGNNSNNSNIISQLWTWTVGGGGSANAKVSPLADEADFDNRGTDTSHLFTDIHVLPKKTGFFAFLETWKANVRKLCRMADVSIIQSSVHLGLSYELEILKDSPSFGAMHFVPFLRINTFFTHLCVSKISHNKPNSKFRFSMFDIDIFDMSKNSSADKRTVYRRHFNEVQSNHREIGNWESKKYKIIAEFISEYASTTHNSYVLFELSEIIRNHRNKISDGNLLSLEVCGKVFQDDAAVERGVKGHRINGGGNRAFEQFESVKVLQCKHNEGLSKHCEGNCNSGSDENPCWQDAVITHDYSNNSYDVSYQTLITEFSYLSMESLEILIDVNFLMGRSNLLNFFTAFDPRTPIFFLNKEGDFVYMTENHKLARIKEAKEKSNDQKKTVYKKIMIELPVLVIVSKEVYFDEKIDADIIVIELGKGSYKEVDDAPFSSISSAGGSPRSNTLSGAKGSKEVDEVNSIESNLYDENISIDELKKKVDSLYKKEDYFSPVKLSITDTNVFIIRKKEWKKKEDMKRSTSGTKEILLDNYNIDLEIVMKVLSWEYSSPWMQMFVTTPNPVNIKLSNSKIKKILEITNPKRSEQTESPKKFVEYPSQRSQTSASAFDGGDFKRGENFDIDNDGSEFFGPKHSTSVRDMFVYYLSDENENSDGNDNDDASQNSQNSDSSGSTKFSDCVSEPKSLGDSSCNDAFSEESDPEYLSDLEEQVFFDTCGADSLLEDIERLTEEINFLVVKIRSNNSSINDTDHEQNLKEINRLKDFRSSKYDLYLEYKMKEDNQYRLSKKFQDFYNQSSLDTNISDFFFHYFDRDKDSIISEDEFSLGVSQIIQLLDGDDKTVDKQDVKTLYERINSNAEPGSKIDKKALEKYFSSEVSEKEVKKRSVEVNGNGNGLRRDNKKRSSSVESLDSFRSMSMSSEYSFLSARSSSNLLFNETNGNSGRTLSINFDEEIAKDLLQSFYDISQAHAKKISEVKENVYLSSSITKVVISYDNDSTNESEDDLHIYQPKKLQVTLENFQVEALARQNSVQTILMMSLGSFSVQYIKDKVKPSVFCSSNKSDFIVSSRDQGNSNDANFMELKFLVDKSTPFQEKNIYLNLNYLGICVETALFEEIMSLSQSIASITINYFEELVNDADALFFLARHFKNKNKKDPRWRMFLEKSAALDHPKANLLIAKGPDDDKDSILFFKTDEEKIQIYYKIIENYDRLDAFGNPKKDKSAQLEAQCELFKLFKRSGCNRRYLMDLFEEIRYDDDYAPTQFCLGESYQYGDEMLSLEKDIDIAVKHFRKGAMKGDKDCISKLHKDFGINIQETRSDLAFFLNKSKKDEVNKGLNVSLFLMQQRELNYSYDLESLALSYYRTNTTSWYISPKDVAQNPNLNSFTCRWLDDKGNGFSLTMEKYIKILEKSNGVITWFDECRLTGAIQLKMAAGIASTESTIVFITQRFLDKVNSGDINGTCVFEFDYALRKLGNDNFQGGLLTIVRNDSLKSAHNMDDVAYVKENRKVLFEFDYALQKLGNDIFQGGLLTIVRNDTLKSAHNIDDVANIKENRKMKLPGVWPFAVKVTVTRKGYEVLFDENHHLSYDHKIEFNNKLIMKSTDGWFVKAVVANSNMCSYDVKRDSRRFEEGDVVEICEVKGDRKKWQVGKILPSSDGNTYNVEHGIYGKRDRDEVFIEKNHEDLIRFSTLPNIWEKKDIKPMDYWRIECDSEGGNSTFLACNSSLSVSLFDLKFNRYTPANHKVRVDDKVELIQADGMFNVLTFFTKSSPSVPILSVVHYQQSFIIYHNDLYKRFNNFTNMDLVVSVNDILFFLTPAMLVDVIKYVDFAVRVIKSREDSIEDSASSPTTQAKIKEKSDLSRKLKGLNLFDIDDSNAEKSDVNNESNPKISNPIIQLARVIKEIDGLISENKCFFKRNGKIRFIGAGMSVKLPADAGSTSTNLVLQTNNVCVTAEFGNRTKSDGFELDVKIKEWNVLIEEEDSYEPKICLSLVKFEKIDLNLVVALFGFRHLDEYRLIKSEFFNLDGCSVCRHSDCNCLCPSCEVSNHHDRNLNVYFKTKPISVNICERKLKKLGAWNSGYLNEVTNKDVLFSSISKPKVKDHKDQSDQKVEISFHNFEQDFKDPSLYQVHCTFERVSLNIESLDVSPDPANPILYFSLSDIEMELKNEYLNNSSIFVTSPLFEKTNLSTLDSKETLSFTISSVEFKELINPLSEEYKFLVKISQQSEYGDTPFLDEVDLDREYPPSKFLSLFVNLYSEDQADTYKGRVSFILANVQSSLSHKSLVTISSLLLLLSDANNPNSNIPTSAGSEYKLLELQSRIKNLSDSDKSGINSSSFDSIEGHRVKQIPISNPLATSQENAADLNAKERSVADLLYYQPKNSWYDSIKSWNVNCKVLNCGIWIPLDDGDVDESSDCSALIATADCNCDFAIEMFNRNFKIRIDNKISNIQIKLANIDYKKLTECSDSGVKYIIEAFSISSSYSLCTDDEKLKNEPKSLSTIDIDAIQVNFYIDTRPFAFLKKSASKTKLALNYIKRLVEDSKKSAQSRHPISSAPKHQSSPSHIAFVPISLATKLLHKHQTKVTLTNKGIFFTCWNDIFKYTFPLFELKLKESSTIITKNPSLIILDEIDESGSKKKKFRDHDFSRESTGDLGKSASSSSKRSSFIGSNVNTPHHFDIYSDFEKEKADKFTFTVVTKLDYEINYFNQDLMAWEPLLEPTIVDFRLAMPLKPQGFIQQRRSIQVLQEEKRIIEKMQSELSRINAELSPSKLYSSGMRKQKNGVFLDDSDMAKESRVEKDAMKFYVKFRKSINLNVTIPLLRSISYCVDSTKKLFEENPKKYDSSTPNSFEKEDLSVIVVSNNSGMDLEYSSNDGKMHLVEAGENKKLLLDYFDLFINQNESKSLNVLQLIGLSEGQMQNIPLDSSYSRIYSIVAPGVIHSTTSSHMNKSIPTSHVNIDMATNRGLRTLTVSSVVKIVNNCSMVLNVKLKKDLDSQQMKILLEEYRKLLKKMEDSSEFNHHLHETKSGNINSWLHEGVNISVGTTLHLPVIYCSTEGCILEIVPREGFVCNEKGVVVGERKQDMFEPVVLHIKGAGPINAKVAAKNDNEYEDSETKILMPTYLQNAIKSFNSHKLRKTLDNESGYWTIQDTRERDIALSKCNSKVWRNSLSHMARYTDLSRSYSHWLSFGLTEKSYNFGVNLTSQINTYSSIINKKSSSSKDSKVDSVSYVKGRYLTEIVFSAPVRFINELACGINIKLFRESAYETEGFNHEVWESTIFKKNLAPKEEFKCADIHSLEAFGIVISINSGKSSLIKVPGFGTTDNPKNEPVKLSADVKCQNESILTINFEIEYVNGERIVHAYTPVWIVSSSVFDLEFQHDVNRMDSKSTTNLNGADGLSADQQSFSTQSHNCRSELSQNIDQFYVSDFREHNTANAKIRGVNGIILGPKANATGFLHEPMAESTGFSNSMSYFTGIANRFKVDNVKTEATASHNSTLDDKFSAENNSNCRIIHCGYTDANRSKVFMKMRSCGSAWSPTFSLDDIEVKVNSKREYDITNDEKLIYNRLQSSISPPLLRKGKQVFPFSIRPIAPDPAFPRTKIFIISDKISFNNNTEYAFEIRQIGEENEGDESCQKFPPMSNRPLWFRPGSQMLQLRLCPEQEVGWEWSGQFSINKDNEIYLRLRNYQLHNNKEVVFFAMIQVHIVDSRVSVTIHGNTSAPYRIENHSSYNFRCKQRGANQITPLKPYTYTPYAWDESTFEHLFLDIDQESVAKANIWNSLGLSLNFDGVEEIILKENLSIRVVSEGPTKVMQIYNPCKPLPISNIKKEDIKIEYDRLMVKQNLILEIPDIFVNLLDINKLKEEEEDKVEDLLLARVENIRIHHKAGERFKYLKLTIAGFQIDNQLTKGAPIYESLVHSGPWRTGDKMMVDTATEVELIQDFSYSPGLTYFPLIYISVSPLHLNLEGNFLAKLVQYGKKCGTLFKEDSRFQSSPLRPSEQSSQSQQQILELKKGASGTLSGGKKSVNEQIYNEYIKNFQNRVSKSSTTATGVQFFKHFEISDLKIVLSVNASIDYAFLTDSFLHSHWIIRSMSRMGYSLFSLLSKIDHCPIYFDKISISHRYKNSKDTLSNPFQSNEFFWLPIRSHYLSKFQIAEKVAALVGSLEVIGNPLGLCNNVQVGLNNFFENLPLVQQAYPDAVQRQNLLASSGGFTKSFLTFAKFTVGSFFKSLSNQQSARIFLHGTSQLLKCIAVSVTKSIVHTASAVQLGLLTMGVVENKYILSKPLNLLEGLELALRGFIFDPFYGFLHNGLKGLIFGLFKGSFGVVTRPLFGMLEHSSDLMLNFSHLLMPQFVQIKKHSTTAGFNMSHLTIRQESKHSTTPLNSVVIYKQDVSNSGERRGRSRPPREPKVPLQIYSLEPVCGRTVFNFLKEIKFLSSNNESHENEFYVSHHLLLNGQLLIFTSRQILVLSELSQNADFQNSDETCSSVGTKGSQLRSAFVTPRKLNFTSSNDAPDDLDEAEEPKNSNSGFICDWRCLIDSIQSIEEFSSKTSSSAGGLPDVNRITRDFNPAAAALSSSSVSQFSSPFASPSRSSPSSRRTTQTDDGFFERSGGTTGGKSNGSGSNSNSVKSYSSLGNKEAYRSCIIVITSVENGVTESKELVFPNDKSSFKSDLEGIWRPRAP